MLVVTPDGSRQRVYHEFRPEAYQDPQLAQLISALQDASDNDQVLGAIQRLSEKVDTLEHKMEYNAQTEQNKRLNATIDGMTDVVNALESKVQEMHTEVSEIDIRVVDYLSRSHLKIKESSKFIADGKLGIDMIPAIKQNGTTQLQKLHSLQEKVSGLETKSDRLLELGTNASTKINTTLNRYQSSIDSIPEIQRNMSIIAKNGTVQESRVGVLIDAVIAAREDINAIPDPIDYSTQLKYIQEQVDKSNESVLSLAKSWEKKWASFEERTSRMETSMSNFERSTNTLAIEAKANYEQLNRNTTSVPQPSLLLQSLDTAFKNNSNFVATALHTMNVANESNKTSLTTIIATINCMNRALGTELQAIRENWDSNPRQSNNNANIIPAMNALSLKVDMITRTHQLDSGSRDIIVDTREKVANVELHVQHINNVLHTLQSREEADGKLAGLTTEVKTISNMLSNQAVECSTLRTTLESTQHELRQSGAGIRIDVKSLGNSLEFMSQFLNSSRRDFQNTVEEGVRLVNGRMSTQTQVTVNCFCLVWGLLVKMDHGHQQQMSAVVDPIVAAVGELGVKLSANLHDNVACAASFNDLKAKLENIQRFIVLLPNLNTGLIQLLAITESLKGKATGIEDGLASMAGIGESFRVQSQGIAQIKTSLIAISSLVKPLPDYNTRLNSILQELSDSRKVVDRVVVNTNHTSASVNAIQTTTQNISSVIAKLCGSKGSLAKHHSDIQNYITSSCNQELAILKDFHGTFDSYVEILNDTIVPVTREIQRFVRSHPTMHDSILAEFKQTNLSMINRVERHLTNNDTNVVVLHKNCVDLVKGATHKLREGCKQYSITMDAEFNKMQTQFKSMDDTIKHLHSKLVGFHDSYVRDLSNVKKDFEQLTAGAMGEASTSAGVGLQQDIQAYETSLTQLCNHVQQNGKDIRQLGNVIYSGDAYSVQEGSDRPETPSLSNTQMRIPNMNVGVNMKRKSSPTYFGSNPKRAVLSDSRLCLRKHMSNVDENSSMRSDFDPATSLAVKFLDGNIYLVDIGYKCSTMSKKLPHVKLTNSPIESSIQDQIIFQDNNYSTHRKDNIENNKLAGKRCCWFAQIDGSGNEDNYVASTRDNRCSTCQRRHEQGLGASCFKFRDAKTVELVLQQEEFDNWTHKQL